MKLMNTFRKFGAKLAVVSSVALISLPAMAETNLLDTASTEIGALKTGIVAFGSVVVSLAIAIATISVAKRVINKA